MKLAHKKEEYKFKLLHTQELLAKEKIENENNMLALKKVLASKSKINSTVESKVNHYKDKNNFRDKDQYLNVMYMMKKDKDDINKSKFKEKKMMNDNIESRYESNFIKKSKESNKDHQYDIPSLLSPKMTSDEEDNSNNSMQSSDLEASYDQETFKNNAVDTMKNYGKDKEIKYLKDRLVELIDGPEYSYANIMIPDGKTSTRNKSKGKKTLEFTLKHGEVRDRQGSMSKIGSSNIPKMESRYKYAHKEERVGDLSSTTNENLNKSFSLHNSD